MIEVSKSNSAVRAGVIRIDYTGATRASRALVWRLFSDWRRWQRFSDFYGAIRWMSGQPWAIGSRLRIDLVRPVRTSVDHVITVCSPGECVAWIDHMMGNTMEQWLVFEPRDEGGTQVHTFAELVGPASVAEGRSLRAVIKSFIELWYSRFCRECARMHEKECRVQVN